MKTRWFVSLLAGLAASAALAADCIWTGAGLDNLWSNPDNWQDEIAPTGNQDVAIFPAGTPASVTVGASTEIRTVRFLNPGMTLSVAAGQNLYFNNGGALITRAEEDAFINGPGTISFSRNNGEDWADNQVALGKTLTINAQITGEFGFEHNGTGGTIVLANPNNNQEGTSIITASGVIVIPSVVANTGNPSPLGQSWIFKFRNAPSTLRYTGGTASTDLTLSHEAGGGGEATIEHAGTGTLTLTGPLRSGNDNSHPIILDILDPSAMIDLAGTVSNGGSGDLYFYKHGAGTVRLSSATTHTGMTSVDDGTLEVTPSGSLSADSLLWMRGGRLLFNAGPSPAATYTAAIGAVECQGGDSVIEVAPGATSAEITIASFANFYGTIDFTAAGLGSTTKIFIADQPDGLLGPWATVNGGIALAAYDSAVGIHAASLTTQNLTALGPSTIANDAASVARITAPGTGGGIHLATDPTAILMLSQETATPATISFGGYALITPLVRIALGGASLTLDDGTLAPPSADNRLFLANAAPPGGAALTVNAAIGDNGEDPVALIKTGPGDVVLAGAVTHTGGTWIDGTLTISNTLTTAWPEGGIHGTGGLTLTGDGNLEFPSIANDYGGTTTVTRGIVTIHHSEAFGAKEAPTVVRDGGAIDFIGTGGDSLRLNAEALFAEGAGPDGLGALRNTGEYNQMNAIRYLTLTDDLTVYSPIRLDVRSGDGHNATLNLNGHGITKYGADLFGLTSTAILGDNGTAFVDIREGAFTFESATTLTGGADNAVRVRDGAFFDYWNLNTPVNWTLSLDNGGGVYARGGYGTNLNVWAGPVTLGGDAVFHVSGAFSDTYTGAITGTGPLIKTGTDGGVTFLLGTNNTWTGGTVVKGGTLYATAPGSLPGYAMDVTVQDRGVLALRVADALGTQPGFTVSQIDALLTGGAFQSTQASIGFDTAYEDLDYTSLIASVGITKFGPNKLTISNTGPYLGQIRVYGGELDLSAVNAYIGDNHVVVGESVSLDDPLATLTLGGNAHIETLDKGFGPQEGGQPRVTIGNQGRGVMNVSDNAYISGFLTLGNAGGSVGIVYQDGGVVHNTGGHSNDGSIGRDGYGYYLLSGGAFTNKGYTQVGANNNGVGILHQTGGTFAFTREYDGTFGISRGGTGLVYLEGGEFFHNGTWSVGEGDGDNGYAELTVNGTAQVSVNSPIDLANRNNMTALLNLNGGELNAWRIYRAKGNTAAYVNWNGGLFRAVNGESELFNHHNEATYPDVFIYAGGAFIDIPDMGKSKTVNTPLRAPEGLGLISIPVASGGAGYLGAPFVRITGAGGGSAFARVDLLSGEVTAIEITSPGSYFTIPEVTLIGGGPAVPATLGATVMGPVPSGGLTKLGTGKLTLNAASTYRGPTEVREGILALQHPEALSPYSEISVTGGLLDLSGNTLSNGNVLATGGSVINGTIAIETLDKTGPGTLTLSTPVILGPPLSPLPPTPGLWEGMIRDPWNTSDPNPATGIQLTTRAAIGSQAPNNTYADGLWAGDNHTWIYSGYIWNRAPSNEVWSFRGRFDDHVSLRIEGGIWINHQNDYAIVQDILMTPGPHHIEMRFGDGGGQVGAGGGERFGLSYDPLGRASSDMWDYLQILDPGDGSLLTTELPPGYLTGPGLIESFIPQPWNTTDDGIPTGIQLTTRAGNGPIEANATYAGGLWRGNDHTWIYKGILWNREETPVTWMWRFANFDDNIMLKINGATIGDFMLGQGDQYVSCPLDPGPNEIEVRFGDGGGDAGAHGAPNALGQIGGLMYDPLNRGSTDIDDYTLLEDPGDGTLLTADIPSGLPPPPPSEWPTVNVADGTLRLARPTTTAGLYEGWLDVNFNTWDDNPNTSIEFTTTAANGACDEGGEINGKPWPSGSTYVYTGYIWNRTSAPVTWTFAENFDDNVRLIIAGQTVLDDRLWDNPTIGTITLDPGPHEFEVRFGQGSGGAGGNVSDWWTDRTVSFMVDFQGRGSTDLANYELLMDSGDGSLLTLVPYDLPVDIDLLDTAHVNLGDNGVLDLNGDTHLIGALEGTGTVTGGTLAAGTTISPAGDDAVGTLTFDNVQIESGVTYRLTTDGTASDCLVFTGVADLSGLTLVPVPGFEPTAPIYVIATAPGFLGAKPAIDGFPSKYRIIKNGTNLLLTSQGGTLLILR